MVVVSFKAASFGFLPDDLSRMACAAPGNPGALQQEAQPPRPCIPIDRLRQDTSGALLELAGVGVPTASVLLYFAFPDLYPILDVRALESLGVKSRSQYPVSFWLEYLLACQRSPAATE
jgi:hypothetical protein